MSVASEQVQQVLADPKADAAEIRGAASSAIVAIQDLDSRIKGAERDGRRRVLLTGSDEEVRAYDRQLEDWKIQRDRLTAQLDELRRRQERAELEEGASRAADELQRLPKLLDRVEQTRAAARTAEGVATGVAAELSHIYARCQGRISLPGIPASLRDRVEQVLGRTVSLPRTPQKIAAEEKRVITDGKGTVEFEGPWTEREKVAELLKHGGQPGVERPARRTMPNPRVEAIHAELRDARGE